ncbi:hypothetical protein [Lysinibacillus xylanilyticus]|uniref:Uncharacterized protein n=1 Tax=Lysinibacillus xylanilyticus TaxID=582475 RepID=A0ABT4EYV9_9BACI|nr:hypothetical protein [Lysinibacillus xylanilyticus]MCY9549409.1 hypothetical protein [Lysinibacillus xylanilyticus]
MKKLTPQQRLFLRAGSVINDFERNNFKVSTDVASRAEGLKLQLLYMVRYDKSFGYEAGLILNGLVLATKQAKGQNVLAEFNTACERINVALEARC